MNSTKRMRRQQRQFFTGVGLILLALGIWKSVQGRLPAAPILLGLGTALLVCEFYFDKLAQRLFSGWMAFAQLLGKVNTLILLTLIYFFMIWPLALIRRHRTKKSPDTKSEPKSTWVPIEASAYGPERYYRPF